MEERASRRRLKRPPRSQETPDPSMEHDIVDAQTLGSGAVPERLSDAPKIITRPDLLDDEINSDPYSNQAVAGGRVGYAPLPEGEIEHLPNIDEYLAHLPEAPPELWDEAPALYEKEAEAKSPPKVVQLQELPPLDDDELEVVEPEYLCVASKANFAGPSVLSLLSDNLSQGVDELDDAFSAFSRLQKGQLGFIRIAFRGDNDFRATAQEYVRALKYGQDPEPTSASPVSKMMGIFSYIAALVAYPLVKGGRFDSGPPRLGSKRPQTEELKPVKSADQSIESRAIIKEIENKAMSKAHYEVHLYAGVIGLEKDKRDLENTLESVVTGFETYTTSFQRLVWEDTDPWGAMTGYVPREPGSGMILSSEELGELARIPDDITRASGVRIDRALVKPMLPRLMIPVDDPLNPPPGYVPICFIGKGTEDERILAMRLEEMNQHMFIVGRTGTGKSVLMQWLIYGVAKSGYPIVFMDPHGDSAEEVLDMLVAHCPDRADDIVFVDFGERNWPVQLNPLDVKSQEDIEETVHSIMEMLAFQMRLDGTAAPRAVNYAQQAITALTEANLHLTNPEIKCTLLQVIHFFTDDKFRQLVIQLCSNPAIKEAYDPEHGPFESYSDRQKLEHISPILRAFQPLSNSPSFANVFASPTNRLDFSSLIGEGKIVLLKLSKHGSQKGLAGFVGSLIIPYMLQSKDSWGRLRNPETGKREGRGVRLFVDEAHAVIGDADGSVMTVLAESRKWDFGMVAATQYPQQLDRGVEQAFYGNTASKISLSLDPSAVSGIAQSLDGGTGLIRKDDIIRLPNYYGYMNLLIADGSAPPTKTGPFSGNFLPPMEVLLEERGEKSFMGTPDHKRKVAEVKARSHALVCDDVKNVMARRNEYTARLKQALSQVVSDLIQHDPNLGRTNAFDDLSTQDVTENWDYNQTPGWQSPEPDRDKEKEDDLGGQVFPWDA